MFNKQTFDRCTYEYCRKFLKEDEKMIGICRDCAELSIAGYKKMFRLRSIIGVAIIGFVFLFVPLLNQSLSLNNVVAIPLGNFSLTANIWSFERIALVGVIGVIYLIVLCYLLAFARKVKLETLSGYFRSKLDSRGIVSTQGVVQTGVAMGRFGGSPDAYGRIGITVIEIFASIISGPFFFAHGLYTLRKLSAYVK